MCSGHVGARKGQGGICVPTRQMPFLVQDEKWSRGWEKACAAGWIQQQIGGPVKAGDCTCT